MTTLQSMRKLLLLRRVSRIHRATPFVPIQTRHLHYLRISHSSTVYAPCSTHIQISASFSACKSSCSQRSDINNEVQVPVAVDYSSLLQEEEFHELADSTIHNLLEKLEEYGDTVDIDGFDIDYGNQVLTLKLGDMGTYVLNKQTPNRQLWLSSPVSGPARFDWDRSAGAWIYRRNKSNLLALLQNELEELCGRPISLS